MMEEYINELRKLIEQSNSSEKERMIFLINYISETWFEEQMGEDL